MSKLTRTPTVAIITAREIELDAVEAVMSQPVSGSVGDFTTGFPATFGTVPALEGVHQVVAIAGGMGNNNAVISAIRLREFFPSIKSIIIVGIAGGIPNVAKVEDHVRLGDVVVSDDYGVIKYDYVKEHPDGTLEHRHWPNRPGWTLLRHAEELNRLARREPGPWVALMERIGRERSGRWQRPAIVTDVLLGLEAPYTPIAHPYDEEREVHPLRIFFGPIASADTLQKNPASRDYLRDRFKVKAIEMEGAGIADSAHALNHPYLVVRGISDYCDRHKDNVAMWRQYAALAAAAFTWALLGRIPAGDDPRGQNTTGSPREDGGSSGDKGDQKINIGGSNYGRIEQTR